MTHPLSPTDIIKSNNQLRNQSDLFTPNWFLNDLTLNCRVTTLSLLPRLLFIETVNYWIYRNWYWSSHKRNLIGTLYDVFFKITRYVLNELFHLTSCLWKKQLLFFCFWCKLDFCNQSQCPKQLQVDMTIQQSGDYENLKKLNIICENLNFNLNFYLDVEIIT